MPKGCIIYCIEKGILENHTLLSISSVKQFGGFLSQYDIFCLQPRPEFPISKKTIALLLQLGVKFIDKPLNTTHRYYSIANKPFALKYVIDKYEYDQYIFLDGDTIVLNEPKGFLKNECEIALSPVYTKGIGIHDFADANGDYWKHLLKICENKNENMPRVKTVFEEDLIVGYWNAGIMAINGKNPIVNDWVNLMVRLLEDKIYPAHSIFFVEQSALAATLISGDHEPYQLPLSHNFPLSKKIFASRQFADLNEICVIHHLNNLDLLKKLPTSLLSTEKIDWISEKSSSFKITKRSIFSRTMRCYSEFEKKLKERIYYFIYKFASHEDN
jgi:lipopolysaccharide biosynthesis glycosyltransferase